MEFITFLLTLLLLVVYIIGLAKLLSCLGASTVQIIFAIFIPLYLVYLIGEFANKKILSFIIISFSVVCLIAGVCMISSMKNSIDVAEAKQKVYQQSNLREEYSQELTSSNSSEMIHTLANQYMICIALVAIFKIVSNILKAVLWFLFGRECELNIFFCLGLALLPAVFVPIIGFASR